MTSQSVGQSFASARRRHGRDQRDREASIVWRQVGQDGAALHLGKAYYSLARVCIRRSCAKFEP